MSPRTWSLRRRRLRSSASTRSAPFATRPPTSGRLYNQVYRLGPIEAYDLNLVKRIEVASVLPDDNYNAAYVRLLQTDAKKARAQVQINHGPGTAAKQKKVWVKRGDDLAVLSDGRQEYANGYIVDDISFRPGGRGR